MSFAEQLKQLREKAGLTQVQLAERAQISLGTLREYEQGKRRHDPSLSVAARLAAVLGVSVDVFARSVLEEAGPAGEPAAPAGRPRKQDTDQVEGVEPPKDKTADRKGKKKGP